MSDCCAAFGPATKVQMMWVIEVKHSDKYLALEKQLKRRKHGHGRIRKQMLREKKNSKAVGPPQVLAKPLRAVVSTE